MPAAWVPRASAAAGPTGPQAKPMRVHVRGYLGLQAILGDRPFIEFGQERVMLQDVLTELEHRVAAHPAWAVASLAVPGRQGILVLLLNGCHVSHLPDGLDTMLAEGDQVAVFPPVAGG